VDRSEGGGPNEVTEAFVASIPDAEPRPEERSRYGNPEEYEVLGRTYRVLSTSTGYEAEGMASWYGPEFQGRRTSSGEPYDMYAMTAAHTSLPLPTYVEVTNLENERRVVVRVNDRGPFHEDRIIDLSYVAAWKLGMIGRGTARVRVRALEPAAR
jgi:rare lipoprotein A